PSGYQALKEELFAHLNSLNIEGNTVKNLGRAFINNRFRHLSTIGHHLLLEQLRNQFAGTPAILVAGGPSLDQNIHLLSQAREKALVLAVDTVLPSLVHQGIKPHFLSTIDPKNHIYEKIAGVIPQAENISLISTSWSCPKMEKIFPADQVFWTFTAKPLEAWLNSLLGGSLLTSGAGTVAHLNLIAADILGCDPIIFIGQDLAYTGTASHAQHTVLSHTLPGAQPREGETVTGVDGTTLRTSRSFLSMKKHFESLISGSAKTFINASQGAHIQGTTPCSLEEALATYCPDREDSGPRLAHLIRDCQAIDTAPLQSQFRKTRKEIKQLGKEIKEADRLNKSLLKELKKNAQKGSKIRDFHMLPKNIRQKTARVDELSHKLDKAQIWPLLQEVTMDGLQDSERRRASLEAIKNDPDRYLEWLIKNMERLLEINSTRKEVLELFDQNLAQTLNFQKEEEHCLQKIAAGEELEANRFRLLRLYMQDGAIALARPLAEKLRAGQPDSAELFFHLGCIAANRSELRKMEENFARALEIDPGYAREIEKTRQEFGNEYLGYVPYFEAQQNRWSSVKYLVGKGLKYAPDHTELIRKMNEVLQQDLADIENLIQGEDHEKTALMAREWKDRLLDNEGPASRLDPELISNLFTYSGKLESASGRLQEAAGDFRRALEFFPSDPALYMHLVEIYFSLGDFEQGIATLNRAIEIDRSCAAYWENIGDRLHNGGQYQEAITAFENCYLYQPENIALLKKIGDCYRATNQLEAARAAYQQLKEKMTAE
ncbi:MAG: 6-hydroxymethylpterin diphosphokinase MptE-like protein, partial [Desulfobia sp.]